MIADDGSAGQSIGTGTGGGNYGDAGIGGGFGGSGGSESGSGNALEPERRWVIDYTQVWVEDSPAWDEQIPIYQQREISVCNVCGATITGNEAAHAKAHALAGEGGSHRSEFITEIVGYDTVHHEAVGHSSQVESGGH